VIRRLRNLAFIGLVCVTLVGMNEGVLAFEGWSCSGVWGGCELSEGDISDCYNNSMDSICESYGGTGDYSACEETPQGWQQFWDCTVPPGACPGCGN
jgi:hypothetical protein